MEEFKGEDAQVVAIAPDDFIGIVAYRVHGSRFDWFIAGNFLFLQHPQRQACICWFGDRFHDLVSVFITEGTGTDFTQFGPRDGTYATIAPGDLQVVVTRFRQSGGAGRRTHGDSLCQSGPAERLPPFSISLVRQFFYNHTIPPDCFPPDLNGDPRDATE